MASLHDDLSDTEQLLILGAVAFGVYILYSLYQSATNAVSNAASAVESGVESVVQSPAVDPSSGISLFSWLP